MHTKRAHYAILYPGNIACAQKTNVHMMLFNIQMALHAHNNVLIMLFIIHATLHAHKNSTNLPTSIFIFV